MTGETTRRGGFVGMALLALASAALAGEADDEAKRMEGTWDFAKLTSDGEDAPQEFLKTARWTIRNREILIPGPAAGKSSFTLDPAKSPKALDMTGVEGPGKGRTMRGIYKLEGDRLTICFPEGKQESKAPERPTVFDGGKGRSLLVLERAR